MFSFLGEFRFLWLKILNDSMTKGSLTTFRKLFSFYFFMSVFLGVYSNPKLVLQNILMSGLNCHRESVEQFLLRPPVNFLSPIVSLSRSFGTTNLVQCEGGSFPGKDRISKMEDFICPSTKIILLSVARSSNYKLSTILGFHI